MRSPDTLRPAFVRVFFAFLLSCILVVQSLLGGGLAALAEPATPKVEIQLERVTEDELPTGSQNRYRVTVKCSYLNGQESEDNCLEGGEVKIDGVPEGWDVNIEGNPNLSFTNNGERSFGVKDIGKEGATVTAEFTVTPPNYVTPNETSWVLKATLEATKPEKTWETDVVKTTAVAAQKLEVEKKALQESTWIGDTVYWEIASDIDSDTYGDLGIYRPAKIEYTDVLPVGFDVTEVLHEGEPFEYKYDPATRKLTWTLDGLRDAGYHTHTVHKFEVHTKVSEAACEREPAPCTLTAENKVTAAAIYSENDVQEKPASATVTLADRLPSFGIISKKALGVTVKEGDQSRKGIFRRTYDDVQKGDWDGKKLWLESYEARNADNGNPLIGDRSSIAAGGYTVNVDVREGDAPIKDGSSLLPLTQSYEDNVPCMDPETTEKEFLFKSRTDGKPCQKPAFHVTAVEISRASGGSLDVGNFTPVAVLTNGDEVPLEKLGAVEVDEKGQKVTDSVVYWVPKSSQGRVSRIVADPGRPLAGKKTWKMTIGGFADKSVKADAILRNQEARVKVWANGLKVPIVDGGSPVADLHILSSLYHVEKRGVYSAGGQFKPVEDDDEPSKVGITWAIDFSYRGKTDASGDIIISDLLPRGMEIMTDQSLIVARGGGIADAVKTYNQIEFKRGVSGDSVRTIEPKIIESYRDGRTLVQWKIPHSIVQLDGSQNADLVGQIRYTARPLHYGDFANDVYLTDASEPNFRCAIEEYDDSGLDIDSNTKTTKGCHSKATWSLTAPGDYQALNLSKAVKGPNDQSFAYTPKKALVPEAGGDVTYRVEALNSSGKPMSKLVAYDVLPYKGDTGVSSDLSGEKRGSTQSAKFTGMTKVPDGVKVFYSTSVNPCRPEVFEAHKGNKDCDNDWSSTVPKDPGLVKALKFVYEGELNPRETLTVEFAMSVPPMKATTDVVWNSVAAKASFAEGASLPAIEAPKVGAARVLQPQFAVEKKPGKATVGNGKWSSSYTVTVKNTSPFEGTSSRVTDTPKLPKGFEFNKVLVDGAEVNFKNGSFPVTAGEKLAAGKSKSFKVVVSGTYTASEVDWAAAAKCEPGDGGASGGLVNTVAMADDSDGPDNNSACNPVPAKFSVKKEAVGKAIAKNGTWSSTYKVTVKNTGDVKGVSKPVKDTPSVPAGFTVTSAKVDKGEPVELTDGSFTVTDGVELAPGKEQVFTVVISGSFDPAKVVKSEVSECASAGAAKGAHGFVNKVTMGGDTDGAKNNTACTTVEGPNFAVKKEAAGEATAVNGKWSSTYTVTVTNTGVVAGKSAAVTDTPSAPNGFLIKSAKIDEGEPVSLTDGKFTVTEGVELAPGKSKSFTVVISGTFVPGKTDDEAASKCDSETVGAYKSGFFNQVSMRGDSDGSDNNNACNPVGKTPNFAVKKTGKGEATAVNGKWSSTYTVTVTNTGVVAGKSAAVTDKPTAPKGFDIQKATVEGTEVVLKDGVFTVTGGEELAPGESKSFAVVVSGSFDAAKVVESEVSACAGDGAVEGAHGFVNEVTMNGDSDGDGNNTACTTVEDDPKFAVKKDSGEASADQGSWSSSYTVTVSNTGVLSGMSQPVTDMPSAPEGFVIENVSVEGEDVALADGSFTVTDGVELAPGESKSFSVVVSGSYEPAGADWAAAAKCAGEGEDSISGGFVNQVTMNNDSDGQDNNTACNAVVKDPLFAVKKEPGEASAENGTWSSTYTVTVSNTGEVKGTSQAVTDTPRVPAGFTVNSAMVDGKKVVLTDGAFTVTDGVELAFGGSKSFEVVVSGSYDAKADWAAAAACDTNSGTASGGLFNEVSMPGDSDGEGNNSACNAVDKPDTPAAPAKPAKPVKPQPGLPLPRTGAPIGLSAAAGLFAVVAGCTILVAGRRSRRS